MINERHFFLGVLVMLTGACKGESSSVLGGGDDLNQSIAGQTGDGGVKPWRPGGGSSDSICPSSGTAETLASLEDITELGFSAADILAFVAGSHEARVHWNAAPVTFDFTDYALQVTPGDLDEALRVTLSHDGSAPRYRTRQRLGLDGGVAADCLDQLELDVTVELRSDSGALDERWWGTLKASTAAEGVVLLQAPTWRGRLPNQPDRDEGHFVNAQEGSLDVVDADDPGSELAWLDVLLRFRTDAIDGSVNGWVQDSSGGAFALPQIGDARDPAAWIGVIGDGFYENVRAIE